VFAKEESFQNCHLLRAGLRIMYVAISITSSCAGNSEISRLALRWSSWRMKWSLGRFILGAPVSLSVYNYIYASLNDGDKF